jgi:flagellar biosynthesis protein FliR
VGGTSHSLVRLWRLRLARCARIAEAGWGDMNLTFAWADLSVFLLAFARSAAWLQFCPPFNNAAINSRLRAALAFGLSLLMTPLLKTEGVTLDASNLYVFASAIVFQIVIGAALGFLVYVVFIAIRVAGDFIDLQAGFAAASIYDPFSQAVATPIGRFVQLLSIMILFAINGHLMLVRGFVGSFQAAPVDGLRLDRLAELVTIDLARLMVSALEIAAPILATLFLTELVLGLLSRVSPQMNVLVLGFIAKTLLVIVLVGLTVRVLPTTVENLLVDALRSTTNVAGG